MRRIIIDTDPGIDDALAIMAAFENPDIEILGITSVAGNKGIDNTTNNACKIATYYKSNVNIYKGAYSDYETVINHKASKNDLTGDTHGEDGLGFVNLECNENLISDVHAVDFILATIKQYPDEVDIITLGPLTNIALAIEKDVEVMKRVQSIHSMGGGVFKGNVTPVAEFNYWFDPIAVDIVYKKLGKFVPITMVGLDVTHQVVVDLNDLEFMNLAGGDKGKLIHEMTKDYVNSYWQYNKMIGIVIHDLMAMIGYIYPEIYTKVHHANLRCVIDDNIAKGQCVVDLLDNWGLEKNVYVPMTVDHDLYKEKMFSSLFGEKIREQYTTLVLKKGEN